MSLRPPGPASRPGSFPRWTAHDPSADRRPSHGPAHPPHHSHRSRSRRPLPFTGEEGRAQRGGGGGRTLRCQTPGTDIVRSFSITRNKKNGTPVLSNQTADTGLHPETAAASSPSPGKYTVTLYGNKWRGSWRPGY